MTFGSAAMTFSATMNIELYGGFGYGYLPYKEFSFTNVANQRKFVWAVHGYDKDDACTMNAMCVGCSGSMIHLAVPYFVGIIGDVLDWLDGTSAPSAPSGGGKPVPAPAPPPFPPASTWFLGIKPLKPVAGFGSSKFDASRNYPGDFASESMWQKTQQQVFSGSVMAFVKYEEFCLPTYRRRELRSIRAEPVPFDPYMKGVEEELDMLRSMDVAAEYSMTKQDYEKELYYMGLSQTKASKELSFSKMYDFEYERAKTAGFFVEKRDERGETYFDPKYRIGNARERMQEAMELEARGRVAEAQALLLGPPSAPTPPRPRMTRETVAGGLMINRLCTSDRRCGGEAETCDGNKEILNKYKEGSAVGGTKGKSLHAILSAQLGPKGAFELFDTDSWDHKD